MELRSSPLFCSTTPLSRAFFPALLFHAAVERIFHSTAGCIRADVSILALFINCLFLPGTLNTLFKCRAKYWICEKPGDYSLPHRRRHGKVLSQKSESSQASVCVTFNLAIPSLLCESDRWANQKCVY